MKIQYILYCAISIILVACNNKQDTSQTSLQSLDIKLEETTLGSKSDTIDFTLLPRLTQMQYDNLQLAKVKDLADYDINSLSMGSVLLEDENGQIITIQIITEGEITEYLLSYDSEGNLTDNLLVAYEDMVEYYSQISSIIKANEITIQTVNFDYSGEQDKSDTLVATYQITPELKFIAN